MVRLLILALMLSLAGCNSQQSASDVQINTSGIFTPVSISYDHKELKDIYDFGEYLIGSGPALYILTVTNNSLFPVTQLSLTMDSFESFGFSFEKTDEGKTIFPGKTGTCGTTLLPTQSCTIVLQFETNISKFYEQPVTISYLNYIEAASKIVTLQVLAGNPASLVFDNEITNYYFGELIGMAQLPVIERDINQEYSQILRITNAGDLRARNIIGNIGITQTCASAFTKSCPAGQNTAYRITHNCPKDLAHGESCEITLFFKPLNQALTQEMKNVRYDGVVKISYKTSANGTDAALNGYATTTSTNIEAVFETSIESQIFENTIVVGNRDMRSFRVNNRGFRTGFLRKLVFKDLLGVNVASCVADTGTTPWLQCYDSTLANIKSLADFPFKIKDKNDCLASPINTGKIIPVDQGCQFDILFQPSITYQTAKTFNLQIFAEFDSLWKGVSNIVENELHTLTSQSLNAAKLIPVSILYNNVGFANEPFVNDTLVTYQGGRVGLMSPKNYKRRSLLVTFKNTGGVNATAVLGKDGRNNNVPQKELNPTGVSLGQILPHYYTGSMISTSNCTEISPGASCTMQFNFAPVTLYDWDKNAQNMFDVVLHDDLGTPAYNESLDSYKQFIFTYQDGSTYTDANTTTAVVDSGANQGEARLKMDLVEKGQLDDYSTQGFGAGTLNQGSLYRREIKFSNIGTKDIPYLPYVGDRNLLPLNNITGTRVVATNPSKLDADTLDCLNIFDFYYKATDTLPIINARSNVWAPFPVGTDCILTIEFFPMIRTFAKIDAESNVATTKGISRNNYYSTNNTILGWDYKSTVYLDFKFALNAYDGDVTDPLAVGPFASQFGKFLPGKSLVAGTTYRQLAKINPYSPRPMASSLIYRPGWTRPSASDEAGSAYLVSSIIPAAWFFSDFTEENSAFSGFDADFFKGLLTKSFFPLSLPTLPNLANYDFVYYLGAVPSGVALNGSLTLANTGNTGATLKSSTINTILRPNPMATSQHFSTSLTTLAYPLNLAAVTTITGASVTGRASTYTFSATDAGVYASELLINYEDGAYTSPGPFLFPSAVPDPRVKKIVQRKILVVAEITNATPELKLDVQDYDVSTDDLNPAVESLGAINTTPMTYFEDNTPILNLLTFSSIKIPTPVRKDSYIKKRFIFYNPSATTAIQDVKLFFRSSAATYSRDGLQAPSTYYLCLSGSQSNAALAAVNNLNVAQPMCTGTCGTTAFNLAPNGSCYIEVRYQPNATAISKSATLTAVHKVDTDRYVHRNIDLNFAPQDPAAVTITNRSPQVIRTSGGTMNSYALDFGAPIQTANPMVFTYDAATTGGWNKMLQLNNPSTVTKASFLKSYQLYYKQFVNTGISDAALKVKEPVYPTDYTKSVSGILYTLIWQQNYPSSVNPRVQIWANQQCLVGDNTGAWFQKGFLGASCRMIPVLFADINYINRTLSTSIAADMDPNSVRIQYYNANRTSTGAVTIHFTGSMKPNNASVSAPTGLNFYQNVQATNASSGQVIFKWAEMNPATAALGAIVGYRVYYADTSAPLNTVFPAAATPYIDAPVNGTGIYQLTHNNLGSNRFKYYRIFPIRYNAAYTHTPNPFGLTSGKYLSDPNVPVLPVVVPNNLFIYQHAGRYLIEKGVFDVNLLTNAVAKTKCTSRIRLAVTQGTAFQQYSYAMINQAVWDAIKGRADGSSYNLTDYPLWLDSSVVNIHAKLSGNAQYIPTADMSFLDATSIFYIKKTGCGTNCSGNTAVANAFGRPNYTSYIEPTVNFAGARCYIQLP